MQIRERMKKRPGEEISVATGHVQLLRAFYDPKAKRTMQKALVSFRCGDVGAMADVPAAVVAKLSPEEVEQLGAFFRAKAAEGTAERRKEAVKTASSRLVELTEAVKATKTMKPAEAKDILVEAMGLVTALKRIIEPKKPAK